MPPSGVGFSATRLSVLRRCTGDAGSQRRGTTTGWQSSITADVAAVAYTAVGLRPSEMRLVSRGTSFGVALRARAVQRHLEFVGNLLSIRARRRGCPWAVTPNLGQASRGRRRLVLDPML